MLIIWVVVYSLGNNLTAEEGGAVYAKYNIGLLYHCGQ